MKKVILLAGILLSLTVGAQTYVSGSFSYYNGTGTFAQKSMGTIELGRVVKNVATLGLAVGKTNFSAGKTYVEFRPSFMVWQNRGFYLSGTLGGGYIFDSPQDFLMEYCVNGGYNVSERWVVSIFAGAYKFDGKSLTSNYTFCGTGITYVFKKKNE